MIILRLPPYPINITYDVPLASTNYLVTVENATRTVRASQVITSSVGKKVTLSLAGDLIKYDHDYSVEIYKINNNADTEQNIVVQDMLTVIRPYVNPNTLGTTATEIAEAKRNENIARAIVDSFTGRGFTFERKILEVVGQGTDYIPVWETIYKINQVFENGKLVYDITNTTTGPALDGFNYEVTKDRTSIVKVPTDSSYYESKDRAERKPLKYRDAGSDSFYVYAPYENYDNMWTNTKNTAVAFPEGFDYIIDYDSGYKVIPHDVQDAVEMIIDDLKCGRMDHYKSYVNEYETDQFKIKYNSSKFSGTGNILVDTVLKKYTTDFRTPGML
jgi:hypothetical protein